MDRVKDSLKKYGQAFLARSAARERLPRWLALLQMLTGLVFCAGTVILFLLLAYEMHSILHSGHKASGPALALMFFSSFFAALAPGFMAANAVLWIVPPVRRALNENAIGVEGASFRSSMRDLWKIARIALPIGFALALLGAIEPWAY